MEKTIGNWDNDFAGYCPHCISIKIIRFGTYRHSQRYKCKTCNKTFIANTGKPSHGLHLKGKLHRYLQALYAGESIRKAAKYASISKNTSFAWRHKFLTSLQSLTTINTKTRIIGVKMLTLQYSAKGRKKEKEEHTTPTRTIIISEKSQYRLHKLNPADQVKDLAKKLQQSEKHSFIAGKPDRLLAAAKRKNVICTLIADKKTKDSILAGIEHFSTQLLNWMERFKGVASKYLQNYWNWYAALQNSRILKDAKTFFNISCQNQSCLPEYFQLQKQ